MYRLPPSLDPGFCPAPRLAHQRKREGFGGTRGSEREEYQGREPVYFLWTAPFLFLSILDGDVRCNSTYIPFAYAPFGVEVPEERMTCPPIFCSAKSATAHRYRHFDERIKPVAVPQWKRRGTACRAPTPGNDRAVAAETSGRGMLRPSGNVGARHAAPQRSHRGRSTGSRAATEPSRSGHGMPCPDPGHGIRVREMAQTYLE